MGASTVFPSSNERKAASALLLLGTFSKPPPPLSSSPAISLSCCDGIAFCNLSKEEVVSSCISDSCSSAAALTNEGPIRADALRILALTACCLGTKRKVVRRARSKILYKRNSIINDEENKQKWHKQETNESDETGVSSLSSASSTAGSGAWWDHRRATKRGVRKRSGLKGWLRWRLSRKLSWTPRSSSSMKRRAESIIEFLNLGCSTEHRIRKALGDSPDTSKALRMLLKLQEVKRSGGGGRKDPFLYKSQDWVATSAPRNQIVFLLHASLEILIKKVLWVGDCGPSDLFLLLLKKHY